jgi:sulfite reductase (NADPH) flavoprotein alpha-component
MHKTIWYKIHWFFGVIFGLTLLIVGFSGAVLSYEKEILRFLNPNTYNIPIAQDKQILKVQEILQKYQSQNPDTKINSISFSNDKSSSVVLNIASKDPNQKKGQNIYLNPYTVEILPELTGKVFS